MKWFFPHVHPEWYPLLEEAFKAMDTDYLQQLNKSSIWLPGAHQYLNAFSLPLSETRYILLGESPYPRVQSANGYAFWDAAVDSLWSETGLSRAVNRATSLRNMIKMLLYSRGMLQDDLSQKAISELDCSIYYQTGAELFSGLIRRGFLLLNASLVYEPQRIPYHAAMWRPFLIRILDVLAESHSSLKLLLFGKVAEKISVANRFSCLIAEHPYNISFITNPNVVNFFKPLDVLYRYEHLIND